MHLVVGVDMVRLAGAKDDNPGIARITLAVSRGALRVRKARACLLRCGPTSLPDTCACQARRLLT